MEIQQMKTSACENIYKRHDYAIKGFKLRIYWYLLEFIRNHYCNKLDNSGKKQVSVQCFFVLCFMSCHIKTVLEVVDGFLPHLL